MHSIVFSIWCAGEVSVLCLLMGSLPVDHGTTCVEVSVHEAVPSCIATSEARHMYDPTWLYA